MNIYTEMFSLIQEFLTILLYFLLLIFALWSLHLIASPFPRAFFKKFYANVKSCRLIFYAHLKQKCFSVQHCVMCATTYINHGSSCAGTVPTLKEEPKSPFLRIIKKKVPLV